MRAERILLVDTEKNILIAYNAVLAEEGYKVEVASTVDEALEKLSLKSLAVLITELYLKGRNTINMIQRAKHNLPELYAIMITASSLTSEQYEEIIHAGVDDIFMKPFSPKDLLITIKKGLKRRSLIVDFLSLEEKVKKLQQTSPPIDDYYGDRKPSNNKLYFNRIVEKEIIRSKRYAHPFSIILLDMKPYADDNKNEILQDKKEISNKISELLLKNTRKTDFIATVNGGFALVLTETSLNGAKILSRRLEEEILSTPSLGSVYCKDDAAKIHIDYLVYPEQSDHICNWINQYTKYLGDANPGSD